MGLKADYWLLLQTPSSKGTSLDQLKVSVSGINKSSNSVVCLGENLNLGHIDWETYTTIQGGSEPKLHDSLLDLISDHYLSQVVD